MQANNILYSLCSNANWFEVRQFLSSNIILSKSSNCLMIHLLSSVMYCTSEGSCLHQACCRDAPDHIVMALLDIGGKELVMRRNDCDQVALQYACWFGASYNVVKMLIDVGGKDLVMAKDTYGNTAMHNVRHHSINDHTRVADKIKLLLQVGDADLLLVTRRNDGKTPLQFATEEGASDEIRNLLTPQSYSNLNSTENNMSSSSISPGDIRNTHSIKQRSNQNHHATYPIQSSTNIEDASLKEAKEYAQKIQQDLDQKGEDYSALEKQKLDIEKEVENQRAKYVFMFEQKDRCEIEYRDRIQSLTELCSKQRAAVKKMKDAKSGLDTGNNSTTPSHITAALGTLKALVDNNFECSICLDTYTNPHVVPECLHRFCGACIKESIRQCGPECPSCRARLTTKRGLRKDNELLEMVSVF
jgi:E3 ubiquitin-protein ligase RNF1/2